jgi:glycogen debranching enzyme
MDARSQFPFAERELFATLVGLITPLGIQASNDELFKGAIFGRDSLRVGLDLVPWLRPLSETILFSLAHFQATEARPIADAKRAGQIPHEVRCSFVGPRKVGTRQQELLNELAERWGGTSSGVVQYGSADATPQFVRLVAHHCQHHGTDILDEIVQRADGQEMTLRECVFTAMTWTEDEIRESGRTLLGFLRSNKEHGHRWQIIQDGATSIVHPDGRLANADARVETIGLQGLAYDALTEGADLLSDVASDDARRWRALATEVRDATLEAFWMPDEGYFGVAIDRDPANGTTPRLVRTITSMPTELLETGIFDGLPEEERQRYISGIVRMGHGPELMTPAGIRSRALRHKDAVPYPDYHGALSCWGVSNSMYAFGLARQGFATLAADVASRHISAQKATGALREFLYVDPQGRVRHPLLPMEDDAPEHDVLTGTNKPETEQAWTVSFVLRTLLDREQEARAEEPWQEALTRDLRGDDLPATLLPAYLDRERGFELEQQVLDLGPSKGEAPPG